MGKRFKYGVYGLGRIGKVHAAIVQEQGHQIVALGDDEQAAVVAAQKELNVGAVKTFNDPTHMAHEMTGVIDAMIIASHTKNHAKDALPFVQARIPIYLENSPTDDLQESTRAYSSPIDEGGNTAFVTFTTTCSLPCQFPTVCLVLQIGRFLTPCNLPKLRLR